MAKVYSEAKRVHVWLPNDDKEKWEDFDPVKLRRALFLRRHGIPTDSSFALWPPPWKTRGEELQRIGSSCWFQRVWTVLEFAFAQECLLCFSRLNPVSASKFSGDWNDFFTLSNSINCWRGNPFHGMSIRVLTRALAMESQEEKTVKANSEGLLTLRRHMDLCREMEASMPVDRVFALYPIFSSNPRSAKLIEEPDYSKAQGQVLATNSGYEVHQIHDSQLSYSALKKCWLLILRSYSLAMRSHLKPATAATRLFRTLASGTTCYQWY
jgi:hypothetical protein